MVRIVVDHMQGIHVIVCTLVIQPIHHTHQGKDKKQLLELWHRFGTMAQVLSLMATHSNGRSQFKLLE